MVKFKDRTGEIAYNNFGSKMTIVVYKHTDDIDVLFNEYNWIYKNTRYGCFKDGRLRCPYERTIYGIGFLGEGDYKSIENSKSNKAGRVWRDMLRRCYSKESLEKRPTYIGCAVTRHWHNFQNFSRFYEENYYEIDNETMYLDKDILIKGNKIYSPKTCVFVPQNINKLFIKSNASREKYPIGVSFHKSHSSHSSYSAKFQNQTGKLINLGYFETPEEAFYTYKKYKERLIKNVAEKYKDKIPQKLYNAMCIYEVEIND